MGKSSSPPAPDYVGAAEATAAADLQNARYQTIANRPDIFTPEGSRTWQQGTGTTFDQTGYDQAMQAYQGNLNKYQAQPIGQPMPYNPSYEGDAPQFSGYGAGGQAPVAPTREQFTTQESPDKWTGTVNLSPEGQKAFEANQRMQTGLAGLGEQAVGQVEGLFQSPFSTPGDIPEYQSPGTYGENRQNVMDAMMARVNTDIGRDREATSAQLIAQGIPPGSEAYQREMEQLDRKQTDARQQAEISAQQQAGLEYQSALAGAGADFSTANISNNQAIQEALLNRQTPLNEISAFRTGSQVNMPQFQAYGNQQFTGGPDYLGAATSQGQYDIASSNQDIAQKNALMGGLFSLGAAGIGAYPLG